MATQGYSLLEITFAIAILAIVGALSFVVLQGSTEATSLTQAKGEVQANVRDVMMAIASEIRSAYTDKTLAQMDPNFVPPGAIPVTVSGDGLSVSFVLPVPTNDATMITVSDPIVYRYENEDGLNDAPINGKLDEGEDANGDGILTRRIVREQSGETKVTGGVNDISALTFQLRPNASDNNYFTTFYVRVESSKGYGPNNEHVVRAESETTLHLQN
ncbi:MAG: type II secretion system protein [Candidatus Hydrogenedentes bacterium]|nr:type II secretion system protein [Candidatus Hydrogenedentota bacterium]MBI3118869.1 type II secretion system protein [Candidatus Hydrogenedentota bacterium]